MHLKKNELNYYSVIPMSKQQAKQKVNHNYECPRCSYQTELKKNMRRHFFRNNRSCLDNNNLELTDEIRYSVLENHRYFKPPSNSKKSSQENKIVVYNGIPPVDVNRSTKTLDNATTSLTTTINIDTISNIQPLSKRTACGNDVWVLYAKSNGVQSPIRV